VGASGLVLVEAGHGLEDELELRPGLHFASGWLSPAFATDEKLGRAVFEDAYILVSNERIDRFDDILPVLEVFAQRKKPLVIIARDVRGEALATLVLNRRKADALVCAVAAPGEGDWKAMHLGDIAAATGAMLLGDDSGHRLKDIKPAHIGRAGRVEIGRAETIIADGAADPAALAARLAAIREQIAGARYLAFDREQHEQRLARLSGKLAMLRLGAPSAVELERRRQAAKAAVAAARQARAGGAVAGGGAALLHAATGLGHPADPSGVDGAAASVLARALGAPLRTIIGNRGGDGEQIGASVAASGDVRCGYDAAADQVTDMFAAGIVDACEVTVEALLRAVSTAATLATVAVATAACNGRHRKGGA